jgi:hypothetical protein
MKTTIDLPDTLFQSAKLHAQQSRTTLRSLVEEGLRRVLADQKVKPRPAFKLKDARVHGEAVLVSDPRRWHQMDDVEMLAHALPALNQRG